MPELPDIALYLSALTPRVVGERLEHMHVLNPFVLRSVDPPISAVEGKTVQSLRRIGKRIVFAMDDDLFIVIHLMIAGRFRWTDREKSPPKKLALATFDFPTGTLVLTEAGTTRRASITLVRGEDALHALDRGGMNVLEVSSEQFAERLRSENRTLKRALTDPRLFDGIGNAYSDEILHRARLSPVTLTRRLNDEEVTQLYQSSRDILTEWTDRLQQENGDNFPTKVTAFRPEMAVHGKYQQPCPDCGTPVQRIRYATNETNYCARCQTGGRLLADRGLSRLLKQDWPRSIDELD